MKQRSWSIETSSGRTNKRMGVCKTALVIQEIYGGKIKDKNREVWYFYNIIDGQRFDFTETQFNGKLNYMDVESNRKKLADTNEKQYDILNEKVTKN